MDSRQENHPNTFIADELKSRQSNFFQLFNNGS